MKVTKFMDDAIPSCDLPVFLGFSADSFPVSLDLAKCPHLLVAGAPHKGKMSALRLLVGSLLKTKAPDDIKILLMESRFVSFSEFRNVALRTEDVPDCDLKLRELCSEMYRRFTILRVSKCRNISEYNRLVPDKLPFIVCVIDDFADLILGYNRQYERSFRETIIRIAQLGRAVGIHLVIATERPSVDVLPATIRVNFPSVLAFKTANPIDSMNLIGCSDANQLIGKGDLILKHEDKLSKIQLAYLSVESAQKIASEAFNRGFKPSDL